MPAFTSSVEDIKLMPKTHGKALHWDHEPFIHGRGRAQYSPACRRQKATQHTRLALTVGQGSWRGLRGCADEKRQGLSRESF